MHVFVFCFVLFFFNKKKKWNKILFRGKIGCKIAWNSCLGLFFLKSCFGLVFKIPGHACVQVGIQVLTPPGRCLVLCLISVSNHNNISALNTQVGQYLHNVCYLCNLCKYFMYILWPCSYGVLCAVWLVCINQGEVDAEWMNLMMWTCRGSWNSGICKICIVELIWIRDASMIMYY